MPDHLAIGEPQHRHRHMLARLGENAAHPTFLCDHSGTHRHYPLLLPPSLPSPACGGGAGRGWVLELDLDIDAGSEIELHQSIDRLGRRIHDVEEPLVGTHFKLLTA